jgi:hypothetical protein
MRKTIIVLMVCLLSLSALARRSVHVADASALKQALQSKLDDWHKSGKFAGAMMGVALSNGESSGKHLPARHMGAAVFSLDT